jgi:DNA-binding transcriptional ArsR family regulator
MSQPGLIELSKLAQAAECLKVLAHPHRLRMIEMLLASRYTVGELAAACEIPSNIASGHLRLMQRCGFLEPQREGRNIYYIITEPCLGKFLACIRERFAGEPEQSATPNPRSGTGSGK